MRSRAEGFCSSSAAVQVHTLNRELELLDLNGSTFMQNRTLPRGSNWPSNISGNALGAPKPATIGIRRVNDGRSSPALDSPGDALIALRQPQ